jgi:REP element-mobilizing transposase RayT
MHAYLATACSSLKSHAIKVGGPVDHIHIAATLPRTLTVSKLLEEIKKSSSKWFKGKDERLGNFSWQAGYGVFSIGQKQLDHLVRYIEQQEEHHQKQSYQEELREYLEKYGVEYDERYIWD